MKTLHDNTAFNYMHKQRSRLNACSFAAVEDDR